MTLIMDGLLVAAAVFAGTYCFVLGRRLRALRDLDSGLGAAITGMTRTLDEARRVLEEAKGASRQGHGDLQALVTRAETASAQLRILLAATRDLPSHAPAAARPAPRREAPRPPAPAPIALPAEGPATFDPLRSQIPGELALHEAKAPLAAAPDPQVGQALRPAAGEGAGSERAGNPNARQEDVLLAALADFARNGRA